MTNLKYILARHEASTVHKEAVDQEDACQIVITNGGIWEAAEDR